MSAPAAVPLLRSSTLSDDERRLFALLRKQMTDQRRDLDELNDYYNGAQRMVSAGISRPPELAELRAVMGWPRLAVDAPHERLDVEGFRYPDAMDTDDELWDLWQRSNMDDESALAHLDALVFGRSFVVVGTDEDGVPLITVESPLNVAARWDPRRRHPSEVLQLYTVDKVDKAALYLPDQTVTLSHATGAGWTVEDRDQHRMGWCPVMMMTNRGRPHDRGGASEITPEIRSVTDAGCRTLLDLEISREFYAAPQRYILGATEQAFQDPEGKPKSAWETYRGRVLALERDEEGNAPTVGTFAAYDPTAYTKVLDSYAELMASLTGLPPSYLGKTADQPASADAIRMQTDRLVQKVRRKQRAFEQSWEAAMRTALAFLHGGIQDPSMRLETIWRNPEIPTPAATTDSVAKQIAAGFMPPRSAVAGEVLGYTPNQRARLAAEWGEQDAEGDMEALLERAADPDDRGSEAGGGSEPVQGARELGLVEMVQKVYLGVGKVVTVNEARRLLDDAGAGLGELTDQQVADLMLQNPTRATMIDAPDGPDGTDDRDPAALDDDDAGPPSSSS